MMRAGEYLHARIQFAHAYPDLCVDAELDVECKGAGVGERAPDGGQAEVGVPAKLEHRRHCGVRHEGEVPVDRAQL